MTKEEKQITRRFDKSSYDRRAICISGGKSIPVEADKRPRPYAGFGDINRFVSVPKHKGFRREAILRIEVSKKELVGVIPTTLRLFKWDSKNKVFKMITHSSLSSCETYVWGRIKEPGLYGVFGLPRDSARLTTAQLLYNLDVWGRALGNIGGDILNFRKKICALILCAPEFQPLFKDHKTLTQFGLQGLPHYTNPDHTHAQGNICDQCMGIVSGPGGFIDSTDYQILETISGRTDHQVIGIIEDYEPTTESEWYTDRQHPCHWASINSVLALPLVLQWKITLPGPVYSSPVAGHGNLYIGSDDNKLYALDPHDGSIRWSFDAGAKVSTAPLAVIDSGFNGLFITSESGKLYSIDPASGLERWHVDGGAAIPCISSPNYSPSTPLLPIYDQAATEVPMVLYVYSTGVSSRVRAVHAQTGDILWDHGIGNNSAAPPMNSGEAIFVGVEQAGRTFKKLDPISGEEIWSYSDYGEFLEGRHLTPGSATSGVAHLDPRPEYPFLVITSTRNRTVRGLHLSTGEEIWTTVLDDAYNISGFALTRNRTENVLVVSQEGDRLYGLNPDTGARLWRYDCPETMNVNRRIPRPAIWGNYVIYASGGRISYDPTQCRKSTLIVISLDDGTEQWSQELDAAVFSSPTVEAGMVYIGTVSGAVYAFKPEPAAE